MPVYEYRCSLCEAEYEVIEEIKKKPHKKCKKCGKYKAERLISLTSGFVRREPTTVAQLAERNTKKMGKYKRESLEHQKDPDGLLKAAKERKAERRKINKMTDAQKRDYIERG